MVKEMDARLQLLEKERVHNLVDYNAKYSEKLPYFIVFMPEMLDLPQEVYDSLFNLVTMGQPAGIYVLVETRHPYHQLPTDLKAVTSIADHFRE